MKQRIRARIEQELAKQPGNLVLSTQLNKISAANISTFHAFCNKLIRRYYYLLQLDQSSKLQMTLKLVFYKMMSSKNYLMNLRKLRMRVTFV